MPRKKGSKNKKSFQNKPVEVIDKIPEEKKETPPPDNRTLSMFEAAEYLGTTEPTIKLWVNHKHLVEHNGRIPLRSIQMCKFNKRRFV